VILKNSKSNSGNKYLPIFKESLHMTQEEREKRRQKALRENLKRRKQMRKNPKKRNLV